jgi:hypothetical protein
MTDEELDCCIAKEVFEYTTDLRYVRGDPECGGYDEVQRMYENPLERAEDYFSHGIYYSDNPEQETPETLKQQLIDWCTEEWEQCKKTDSQRWCISVDNRWNWEVCPAWSTDARLIPQLCEKLVELGAGDIIMSYDIDYKTKEYEYDVLINAFSLYKGLQKAWSDKCLPRALSLAALAFVRAMKELQEEKGDGKSD